MIRSRLVRLTVAVVGLLLGMGQLRAGTINGFSLPSYVLPGFVIGADAVDGDGATNRHRIDTQTSVTVTTAGSYRIDWELLSPTDTVMASSSTVMGSITTVPDTRTVSGYLEPTVTNKLQPGVFYRLRVKLFNSTTSTTEDTGTQTTGKTYVHMPGIDPGTTDLNAVTELTAITVDRRWLLETNTARQTIPVTVDFTVYRYDNWDGADDPKTVVVNLNTSLIKDSDSSLQTATVTGTPIAVTSVSSYVAGAPKTPTIVNESRTIEIDPASVLLSTGYRVQIQITHQDQLLPPVTITGNTLSSAVESITHFTGQLNFGSVSTHVVNLAGPPFIPTQVVIPGNPIVVRITPSGMTGTVDGITDHHYGDGTDTINVSLAATGIATCIGDFTSGPTTYVSDTILLERDISGINGGTVNGVPFKRADPVKLLSTGVLASITSYLPVGVGWRADRHNGLLSDAVNFPDVYLNQALEPAANPTINPGSDNFYLCEETKPVLIECTTLEWDLPSGEFRAGTFSQAHSVRQPLLDFLANYVGTYEESGMEVKYSNDNLYNKITVATNARVKTGTSSGGELTTVLTTGPNSFFTHFPAASTVGWNGAASLITIQDDFINTNLSALYTATPLPLIYAQFCPEEYENGCGDVVASVVTLTSTTGNLKLTGDGGVHAPGSVVMTPLSWGAIPKALPADPQGFAHQVTTAFTEGNFLMAGTFLRGDQNPLNDPDGPAVLLLTGFDPADLSLAERPESANYGIGAADYPGINFRTTGTHDGLSTLQGDPFGPYDLTARSKYYIRPAGVTGIHEAPAGGFPGTATIGSYMFELTSYAFSFLAGEMEDSRTSGNLDLPDPTDFTLNFTELRLSCLGALEGFEITGAGTVDAKEFDFWNALFTPYSARFESTSTCDPGAGTTLVLGFSGHASHFEDAFAGSLGIRHTGDFVTDTEVTTGAAADTVPARLTLPAAMKMIGTEGESYEFFPAQGAYLNDANGASEGFWSLFGTFDVPFFRDMQAHLHARAGSLTPGTPDPETTSPIYIMGGWPTQGWTISGNDPFNLAVFDVDHDGYTDTLANYRKTTDNGDEKYLPRAQQLWIDLINFDYPVKWSNAAFNFAGRGPGGVDLLVLSTQHELVYLDANYTDLTFGLRYDGLPTLNLSNFLYNAVDDATGMASAFVTAAGDKVFDALGNGVDELARAVSDEADDLLGDAVVNLTDALLDDLIVDLTNKIDSGVYTTVELQGIISSHLGTSSDLTTALNKLDDSITNHDGLLYDMQQRLMKIEQGIDAVIDRVTIDPNTGASLPPEQFANGLLKEVDVSGEDHRVVLEALSVEIVDVLGAVADASTLQEELTDLIEAESPTLASVTETLTEIKAIVTEVRQQIEAPNDLGEELQDLINTPAGGQADIASVTAEVEQEAFDIVLAATAQDLANLDSLGDEWREQIALKIKDSLYAKPLVADIQEAVKERIYDVQASFNEAVDTAFASLNRAISEALSDVIGELDETLDPLQGVFQTINTVKSGSISGFAHINGDSLDLLRLDAVAELALPDPLTVGAYFQIKELDSDGPETCGGAFGEKTAEITLGCENIGLAWTNLDIDGARADMNVKFGLSAGLPVSFGGEFELTEGTLNFETFEVYKLAASVMFGLNENYIAAAVGTRFGEFDMAGGIFLGRSCTLEPLELIDPLVSQVVPTSSITGIYAYGEATFPIFGTGTCFFNISAKAGAGVLMFAEGPTFGGRMTLGVYGEALCAVEVGGEVSLAGTKSGDTYNFAGYGRVFGEAGKCPICVKANFQVDFQYTDQGGWHVDF